MDLAIGAKKVFVMMEHQTKGGDSKIVPQCTYPLTGIGCVNRIYTDLAVLDITPAGVVVIDMADEMSEAELQAVTAVPLIFNVHNK
jgi:3-oxoadipate CoA-transferase beta subunit